MKYIDAEKLKKLIDEKWRELADKNVKVGGGKYDIEIYTYLSVLNLIDSLQQEQPEELEKKIDDWYNTMGIPVTTDALKETARHFYELGLNARKLQPEVDLKKEIAFRFNGKEVSWDEIPLEYRKHDYPYYFDGDIDCYPFIKIENKQ